MVSKKPKKIAIFLPTLGGGGAERVTVTLANQLSNRGAEVHIVLASAEGTYLKDVDSSIRIENLASPRMALCVVSLIKYIRTNRPDVLLSHLNYANVIALLATLIANTGVKTYVVEHASLSKYFEGASVKKRFIKLLMKWLYPTASGVVAVSDRIRTELIQTIGSSADRTHTIYNPIVRPEIAELAVQPVPQLESIQRPLIVAVGRLTNQKGFDVLLEAFAQVRQSRAAQLVVLGEGEERSSLQARAKKLGIDDHILMPGFVQNPYSWMSKADVFVLSSRFEGLPTVLVEAMACGTPVVSTDCLTGPREILEDGKWGLLVPTDDANTMAIAVLKVLDSSRADGALSRSEFFNVDAAVDKYFSVMSEYERSEG